MNKEKCRLILGDCITVGSQLSEKARLVYVDPPYGPEGEDSYYGVGKNSKEYLLFMEQRIVALSNILHDNGSFVLHVDYKYVHRLRCILDDVLGESAFKNEIIWCYSGPSRAVNHFPRKHDNILWYAKGQAVFNQPRVPYSGKLSVGGKTSWAGKEMDKEEYLSRGKSLEDWWTTIPALQRNEKEKTGYKTQKPVSLLTRIVEAFSNKDDLIVDGFMGSCTTGVAAYMTGRRFFGMDISDKAVQLAEERLRSLSQRVFG